MGMPLAGAKKEGAVRADGNFLTFLINFLMLSFIIFQMVRLINRTRRAPSKIRTIGFPHDRCTKWREVHLWWRICQNRIRGNISSRV